MIAGLSVRAYEGINHTPAVLLATRGHYELMVAGLANPVAMLAWDQNAVVAFLGDDAVGVIVWTKQAWNKECAINVGYVLPEYRRMGVYRRMWDELVSIATDAKLRHISSATHVQNDALRGFASAMGRKERGLILEFELPEIKAAP